MNSVVFKKVFKSQQDAIAINKLQTLMDQLSDEAEANGLTPEILESILNEKYGSKRCVNYFILEQCLISSKNSPLYSTG